MKNLTKVLIVLFLSMTAVSCSKASADEADNLNVAKKAQTVNKENHAYVSYIDRVQRVSFIVNNLNAQKGDRVTLEYNNGEKSGTLATVATNSNELMILSPRASRAFANNVGNSDVEFKVQNSEFTFTMPIYGKALLMGMN